MSTKNVLMGGCFFYSAIRLAAAVWLYASGQDLWYVVLLLAGAVSLAGLITGCFWLAGRVKAPAVRFLLGLNAATALLNMRLASRRPVLGGARPVHLLVIGTYFELIVFLLAVFLPMPERPRAPETARAEKYRRSKTPVRRPPGKKADPRGTDRREPRPADAESSPAEQKRTEGPSESASGTAPGADAAGRRTGPGV